MAIVLVLMQMKLQSRHYDADETTEQALWGELLSLLDLLSESLVVRTDSGVLEGSPC